MRLKILLRRALSIVALAGFALLLGLIFRFTLSNPTPLIGKNIKSNTALQGASSTALYVEGRTNYGLSVWPSVGKPVRLKIPSINIDATLEYVGLTPDGAMDVPKGPGNLAWFDLGPRPGDRGTAVISGHYGWKNNTPAVFDNLYKLKVGDKVYVEEETGATTTFVVRESRRYKENDRTTNVFGSTDAESHLNLITCEGIWNSAEKSYSDRLVVFTDKEGK